jgi:phosphate transport system substrate-binding protein
LPLAKRGTTNYVEADEAHALDGTYPLGRFLYVYVNKAPNKPLEPLELEFVKLMLSQEGQQVVVKDGYIPVPAKVIAKTLEELTK